jgi:hypothetical protein
MSLLIALVLGLAIGIVLGAFAAEVGGWLAYREEHRAHH